MRGPPQLMRIASDSGEAWESARQEFEAATRPRERSCTRERSETRPKGRAQDVCGSIRSHPRPWHLIFVEHDRIFAFTTFYGADSMASQSRAMPSIDACGDPATFITFR